MLNKQKIILQQFKGLSCIEATELLANVAAGLAFIYMDSTQELDSYPKNWDEYYEIVMSDIKNCGETIANALGQQALTINLWLTTKSSK